MVTVHLYALLSSPTRQNGCHLADNFFDCFFLNGNDRIRIQISLKYVPRSPIDIKPALVQVMAWRLTSDKPLPGPMMTQFIAALGGDELRK